MILLFAVFLFMNKFMCDVLFGWLLVFDVICLVPSMLLSKHPFQFDLVKINIAFSLCQGGINAALGNMEPDDWRWHM